VGQARGMYALMELADNDLLDVLLGRPHTQEVTKDLQVLSVLPLLKV
jgi:antitoxin CptB